MNYYAYHVEDEELLKRIDERFAVVTVVENPSDGYSPGFEVAIYDSMTESRIHRTIKRLKQAHIESKQ